MKRVLWTALLAAIFSAPPSQGKPWRGIEPLRSTKSDVERVLGKAISVANHWATYETDTEAISILYSNGLPCGAGANSEWRASEGLVISITVAPKTIIAFSSLNLDESKYKKRFDPHKLNHIEYLNEEEGESISVTNGEVSSFTYSPGTKSQLKCPTVDNAKQGAESSYKLDEYGELKRNDEAVRLDNFAFALIQRPGSQGYIFSYAGGAISPSRARMRAKRVKNYLMRVRNLKSSRLIASYAGKRTDFTIELYIRPPQARAPVPFTQAMTKLSSAAKTWREITPLRSTAQDVAKLSQECGKAESRCQFALEDHEVMVVFSGSKIGTLECERVPNRTVLAVIVKFNRPKKLQEFQIRDKRFKVFDPSSLPKRGYKTYYYVEDGFMVNTYKGKVIGLVYIAAQKDIYLCPEYYHDPKAFVEVGLVP